MKNWPIRITKLLLAFFAVLLCSFSCEDEEFEVPQNQDVFFQVEYVNYAWTKNHKGIIIDSSGNVYEYNLPEGWVFQEKERISVSDFENNLKKTTVRSTKISSSKTAEMVALAPTVGQGELGKGNWVMADAGGESYAVYVRNKTTGDFQYYLLESRGDWYQKRSGNAAATITAWLKEVNGGAMFGEIEFE